MNHRFCPVAHGIFMHGRRRVISGGRAVAEGVGRLACLAAVVFAVGCGKSEQAVVPNEVAKELQSQGHDQPSIAPVAHPAPNPSGVAVAPETNPDAIVQQLNRELLKWMVSNRRAPASFEEFVGSAKITVPSPPPGKRYVIGSDKKIVLR